jgi:transketolase N-terminal domain/subunit
MNKNQLKDRIIDISYRYGLSHLGSCLTAVDIIDHIFSIKNSGEKFVLSSGHAGLSLYVVIEKYDGINAEDILKHHGIHPDRCDQCHLDCSSGSLGQGLPIAIGMALADRSKKVYCLISDGECSEGSIWESFNIIENLKLFNLSIYVNINGFGAYREIDVDKLEQSILSHMPSIKNIFLIRTMSILEKYPFLQGLNAHYHLITKEEYDAFTLSLPKSN